MNSDFPLITRITEATQSDDAERLIRLDIRTEDGQRYVRLSRTAARQLLEKLEGLLHRAPTEGARAAAARADDAPFRFKM